MKKVDYEKLAFWKGKKQTEEQKQKKIQKIIARKNAYLSYKEKGGHLKWNDFQKEFYKHDSNS